MAMTATTYQDIRLMYPQLLDKYEVRGELYSLMNKGVENARSGAGIISRDVLAAAAASYGRGVDIPVMSPTAGANGTGISCSFTGTESVSDLVNLTWVTISNGFEMQPAKNDQNDIGYAEEFARKYTDAIRKIAAAIDGLVDTTLTSNITPAAQYASEYVGTGERYPFVADVMQVALANHDDFFNDLPDIMAADDLYPLFDVISSTNGRSLLKKIRAQGEGNSENKGYQFQDGDFNFMFSNNVTVTPTTSVASMFIMPEGAYGIVNRVRPDCENNRTTSDGHEFGVIRNEPTLGMDVGTLFYSTCGDVSPESGNAQDTTAVREYHQMEVMIGLLTPYTNFANSGNSAVIRKADFLKV